MAKSVKAVKTGKKNFEVITPHRKYYFKGLTIKDADDWVESINKVILNSNIK